VPGRRACVRAFFEALSEASSVFSFSVVCVIPCVRCVSRLPPMFLQADFYIPFLPPARGKVLDCELMREPPAGLNPHAVHVPPFY
jgi:hypothetical protein